MTLGQFRERTDKLSEDYEIEFSTNGEDGIKWPVTSEGLFIREMDESTEKQKAIIIV